MSARIKEQSDGNWQVLLDYRVVLADESYQVAASVEWSLNHGGSGTRECDEVARAILAKRVCSCSDPHCTAVRHVWPKDGPGLFGGKS